MNDGGLSTQGVITQAPQISNTPQIMLNSNNGTQSAFVNPPTMTATQTKRTEQDRKAFYRILLQHLSAYSCQILPSLFELEKSFVDRKLGADFQRQAQALISLSAQIVASIRIAYGEWRKMAFKCLNKVVKNSQIGKCFN